jgi:hypothetical protein
LTFHGNDRTSDSRPRTDNALRQDLGRRYFHPGNYPIYELFGLIRAFPVLTRTGVSATLPSCNWRDEVDFPSDQCLMELDIPENQYGIDQ